MAYRLAAAFGTSPELWGGMQMHYDLHQAGKIKRPRIEQQACLVYSEDFQSTAWAYGSKKECVCNATIRPRMAANTGEALLQAAARGLGLTKPPDFMAQPCLDSGSVVPVLHDCETGPWRFRPCCQATGTSHTACRC